MKHKINSQISVKPLDWDTIQIFFQGSMYDLSRNDALRFRNYLNDFVNGSLHEEEEEDSPSVVQKQKPI